MMSLRLCKESSFLARKKAALSTSLTVRFWIRSKGFSIEVLRSEGRTNGGRERYVDIVEVLHLNGVTVNGLVPESVPTTKADRFTINTDCHPLLAARPVAVNKENTVVPLALNRRSYRNGCSEVELNCLHECLLKYFAFFTGVYLTCIVSSKWNLASQFWSRYLQPI